jgi:regulator of sirC expression with transglutaminase-like and TPR domain
MAMGAWAFRDELQLAEINVPRAALQYARAVAYPDLDVAGYMAALHELSEDAADRLPLDAPPAAQAERLANFLFGELGFRGNATHFNDPRNSYLNEVIDRRLGLPITLSVLFVDVAIRLGIPAYGIGLPGHYIVGIHTPREERWLDPFHGGRRLNLSDCAEMIHVATGYEGPLEAGWFAPAGGRETIIRMLSNLRSAYVAATDWPRAAAVIRLLRQAQPEEPAHLRDLGLVYYHHRQLAKAGHFLDTYLQLATDASDAQIIRDGIRPVLDEWVPMN